MKKEIFELVEFTLRQDKSGGKYILEAVKSINKRKVKLLDIILVHDVYAPLMKKYKTTQPQVESAIRKAIQTLKQDERTHKAFDDCSKLTPKNLIIDLVKYKRNHK